METTQKIICGDSLDELKKFPDNYFDSVCTDPPYGLGKEPNPNEVMKDWIEKGFHEIQGKGFMGKEWDSFVPQPILWREVFRVLKPGGHLLCFSGTRTYDWMIMSLRFAGFEIRDQIIWHYASGFPKSLNISKAIDKQAGAERNVIGKYKLPNGQEWNLKQDEDPPIEHSKPSFTSSGNRILDVTEPATDEAKQWDGWGTAIKPASEPICLARKPLSEKTVAENILKWGVGGINIDGCRIETTDKTQRINKGVEWGVRNDKSENQEKVFGSTQGRFPANVVFSHHEDCVCIGTKKISRTSTGNGDAVKEEESDGVIKHMRKGEFTDRTDNDGLETIEEWKCVDGCPIKELNRQSGITKSGKVKEDKSAYSGKSNTGFLRGDSTSQNQHGDSGGASRFFYCAKSSRSERNFGLENSDFKKTIGHNRFDKCKNCGGYILQNPDRPSACKCENPVREDNTISGNHHPTVKPVKLISYLCKLITPPNGTCLDPFNGSGTCGIACKLEGFNYIGIEREKEYCEISESRIKAWENKSDETIAKDSKEIEESENKDQLNLFE